MHHSLRVNESYLFYYVNDVLIKSYKIDLDLSYFIT